MLTKEAIEQMGEATKAIHAGQHEHGAWAFPVPGLTLNSAVLLDSVEDGWRMLTNEQVPNIAYQRYSNPTVGLFEEKFAKLEDAKYALALNSGMTACYLAFRALLKSGDHVVTQHGLYHEISDQLKLDESLCAVNTTFLTDYSVDAFKDAVRPETKMLFVETPTNPTMLDVDIGALADLCRERRITLVVDNTLLTPLLQKPLSLGADIALYSTTKTINGHGDSIGGVITTNDVDLFKKCRTFRDNIGVILDPLSAWLTIRGMRTLPLRLERHTQNALQVVDFLRNEFPDLEVRLPLATPYVSKNQIRANGGVISVVLPGKGPAERLIRSFRLIRIGTTFGNLESLCYHFGTFARPTRDITKIGIPLGLVRLSIGVEDATDVISDLRQALKVSLADDDQDLRP